MCFAAGKLIQAILIDDFDESEAAKAKLLSNARLQTAKDSP